ncbi:MAG: hypothetical protein CBB95_17675 [Alteromonas sp. TMED35]|jgi:hypothetical protein|uniref:hypothetical protein n=1 Tax=uncultured Alteromonas sp. TaxID=179113 RepID=UPI000B700564|nr:MAG: hypothetical protein CBB95_17675 [Alteromonas sp. TMED35]|tara:strand:+ start:34152 stop:34601 length:450 start_codon:yes stop_codon:yes gene_type:complete
MIYTIEKDPLLLSIANHIISAFSGTYPAEALFSDFYCGCNSVFASPGIDFNSLPFDVEKYSDVFFSYGDGDDLKAYRLYMNDGINYLPKEDCRVREIVNGLIDNTFVVRSLGDEAELYHSYTGMTLYIAKVVPLSRLANIKKLVMESNQ